MCGIFGILSGSREPVPSENLLRESARRLHHRGPDSAGWYAAPGVGLAHTRLSFLDVDPRSNQPFWDDERRYCLLFNGEIYNFLELRHELELRGIRFHTTGDTEVLLQALIHGSAKEVLPRLRGMFALALYDTREERLLLARDRFGMKPLYVYEDDGGLLFASEIKALRSWWSPQVDPFSIVAYLLGFGGPTKGCTFYRSLRMVAPGGMVVWKRGEGVRWESYFALPEFWRPDRLERLGSMSAMALVDEMEERLLAAVDSHMIADVPVGAFCSGGVDSSLLTAMAARTHSNLAIFHADIRGHWSEHEAAVGIARHLKLELKSVAVRDEDFVEYLPDVMEHYEHPFTVHPNCAPLMMVARLARDSGVKGLLSGEGSDECFLGYPWLGRKRLVDAWVRGGRQLRRLLAGIPGFGPVLWPDPGRAHLTVRSLLNRREIEDDEIAVRQAAGLLGHHRLSNRDLWTVDYLGYHLRTLLHRNDTMGMAASIEARFPFLDNEVVATAVNLPARYKLRFSPTVLEKAHPFVRDKWIVRQVADRYMPAALSRRIKIGFWTTVFRRIAVDRRYFAHSFVRDLFELSEKQMEAVVDEADQDLAMRLLHLDVWGRICMEERGRDDVRARLKAHLTIRPE